MSQPTPIAVLKEAAERGLTLSINGQKLRVTPTNRLTPDFHETLRQHKWHLLTMLGKRSRFAALTTELAFLCQDLMTDPHLPI
jgi:hypothetical protein